MKKLYLFLIVAALCAIGVSAKTIHVWRNGVKTNVMIQTNDSITFDTQNAPTMRIWSNGDEIYQLELAVDDSITYSHGTTETNNTLCFDYDHWRDVNTINIYMFNDAVWRTVALPWADEVSTTIPSKYRYPNLEFHYDSVAQDTFPTWQLAFNTCYNPTLDGVHMFGLWNTYSNVMRIYSYLEELPNPNAAYCFYRVESSSAAFIDRDAMVWMPSDSVIRKGNWNSAALTGVAATPSTTVCNLMPFASLKTDGSEAYFAPVFAGWVAFDLPLATGTSSVSEHGTLTFSLEAVQSIDAHGTLNLEAALNGTETGTGTGTNTGKITIPGSNTREAAAFFTAFGAGVSGVGSAITSGVSASNVNVDGGKYGGITQGIGAVLSCVGNCINASEESKEKKYGLDFATSTEYDLQLEVKGTIAGEFDAQLTTTLASTAKPLTITYGKFFEELSANSQTNQARKAQKDNGDNGGKISLGIWKLKRQPVYYVSNKYAIARDRMDTTDIGAPTEKTTLISCLDPASIELELNMDNPFFDANEIDSIILIAYDYVFVDSAYNLSAQPYYDYYGIHQDTVHILQSTSLDYTDFLLDPNATYKTFTKGDRSYSGVASDSLAANGLGRYNMVYSPAIHANVGEGSSVTVNEISVAVVVEMTFKNGERRLFAERYLPEIIEFDFYHDPSTYMYIVNSSAPESINGIPVSCPLFDMQKAKALRILP